LKKFVLLSALLVAATFSFVSCGGAYSTTPQTRVLASQSVTSPVAFGSLIVIDGAIDTLARAQVSAGTSPGLMVTSPQRSILLAFDMASNNVEVVNTRTASLAGAIQLPGPTTSMVVLSTNFGYAAVPAAPMNNNVPPGAVIVMNLEAGGVAATISVPNAQTVVASPDGTQLLVFSGDSDVVTVISPLLVNTGVPDTATVSGFDRPVYAVFSSDGTTAYVLNCGPQCASGSASASVQTLNLATLTLGPSVAVDGATIGWLSGSTLYVAGNSPTNNLCIGQSTAATTCGRLDIIDLGSLTVTGTAVITDGYHDRIDMSVNGQLFIGSHTCTNIGNVNNVSGEVRGCLSIFNTTNDAVVIPPDNGDVTGLQSFTTRDVEYVAEGGNLRVYDTLIDSLLPPNNYIETGTIILIGQITDVKAIDFF
jgi:hypothetical protein